MGLEALNFDMLVFGIIKSSTLHYIISDTQHHQQCVLTGTLPHSAMNYCIELHHQRCSMSSILQYIINAALHHQ